MWGWPQSKFNSPSTSTRGWASPPDDPARRAGAGHPVVGHRVRPWRYPYRIFFSRITGYWAVADRLDPTRLAQPGVGVVGLWSGYCIALKKEPFASGIRFIWLMRGREKRGTLDLLCPVDVRLKVKRTIHSAIFKEREKTMWSRNAVIAWIGALLMLASVLLAVSMSTSSAAIHFAHARAIKP